MSRGIRESMYFEQFKGIPLKIAAINLPYVIVHILGGKVTTLDTRRVKFMEVTPEYVQASTITQARNNSNERDVLSELLRDVLNPEKQ